MEHFPCKINFCSSNNKANFSNSQAIDINLFPFLLIIIIIHQQDNFVTLISLERERERDTEESLMHKAPICCGTGEGRYTQPHPHKLRGCFWELNL